MLKYTYKPKRLTNELPKEIVRHLNTELLRQNEELRRVLDSVFADIEKLKKEN